MEWYLQQYHGSQTARGASFNGAVLIEMSFQHKLNIERGYLAKFLNTTPYIRHEPIRYVEAATN